MIKSLGQIMLYVRDLDANAKFWKDQVGFEKIEKSPTPDGDYIYVLSPLNDSEVQLVLQDKNKMERMNGEINLGTPSIMMETDDLDDTHKKLLENGVNANPIVEIQGMRFFNFSDNENNYFAIKEVKKEY